MRALALTAATLAAAAALASPAAATTTATCVPSTTSRTVELHLHSFPTDRDADVHWSVTGPTGTRLAAGNARFRHDVRFPVELPAGTTTVRVDTKWGPHPTRDRYSVIVNADCAPAPPVVPPAPPEPPATAPPAGPPATPPSTPPAAPPAPRKPWTCANLPKSAGPAWRARLGCLPITPRVTRCPQGFTRRTVTIRTRTATGTIVTRKRVQCIPPRRDAPPVTG